MLAARVVLHQKGSGFHWFPDCAAGVVIVPQGLEDPFGNHGGIWGPSGHIEATYMRKPALIHTIVLTLNPKP